MTRALDAIIGESPAIMVLRDAVRTYARTDIPVLIEGPTGAGKELVAAAIHEESGRKGRFVAFNVCAIPESVFESALFGHTRGAFTGAVADATGFLLEADGGTAFFDEIGGLHQIQQAKLLRALETGEFRPVGAGRDVRSDFRIVAATNEGVSRQVEAGRLRGDLAHRFSGVTIRVPSLAARTADIPLLVQHFATCAGAQITLDHATLAVLSRHRWPGNVRELRHVVRCGIAQGGLSARVVSALLHPDPVRESASATRRQWLHGVLEAHNWNAQSAARALSVGRATIYRWMKEVRLEPPLA